MLSLKLLVTIVILVGIAVQESKGHLAKCSAEGDPHYRTFDGRLIHFQGMCQYVLAKDIHNRFEVLGKNENCGNSRVSCTKEVTVKVNKLDIVIKRGGTVTVFGVVTRLPYEHRGVKIRRLGRIVKVETNIGLTVEYDCVYNVYILIAKLKYKGKTRGICGSNIGNKNELRKPDNSLTTNDQDFANSWKVDRSCPNALPPINPCRTAGHQIAGEARIKCQLLRRFPFSKCHHKVNVHSGFLQDCEYDVCGCKEHPSACACEAYAAYATTCGFAGVNINWKHLPQFHHCRSACAAAPCLNGGTCRNVGTSYQCNCPAGYIGSRCEKRRGKGRWRVIGRGCAGARGNSFASLTYNGPPGFVSAFRLTHISGKVGCYRAASTNWGCNGHYRTDMYVTDVRNAVMYPSPVSTKPHHHGGWYHLPGYFENSPQLVLSDVCTRFIYRGQQMRVWYGEDLYGYTEHDNHGRTCFQAEFYFVQ